MINCMSVFLQGRSTRILYGLEVPAGERETHTCTYTSSVCVCVCAWEIDREREREVYRRSDSIKYFNS